MRMGDRQVGELSVVSYCSELASGELQDMEFSKSCRQDLEFSKFGIFSILPARSINFSNFDDIPNFVCKISKSKNLAGKIFTFRSLAEHT